MTEPPTVYARAQVEAAVTLEHIAGPVAAVLMAYSRGETQTIPIGLMELPELAEVHVKAGYVPGLPVFTVKVATMFPGLRSTRPDTSDGVMLVCSTRTGAPLALLHDRKLLTDLRTAAVGVLATAALADEQASTLSVFGTGGQARLQTVAICDVRPIERVGVWGRGPLRAAALVHGLRAELSELAIRVEPDAQAAAKACQVLVTATASREPFLCGAWLRAGQHITAVGADDVDKRELDAACFIRADRIVVDSLQLNGRYGDLPDVARTGGVLQRPAIELGALLSDGHGGRESPDEITIAKHIGIGIEDAAAAAVALRVLQTHDPAPLGGADWIADMFAYDVDREGVAFERTARRGRIW